MPIEFEVFGVPIPKGSSRMFTPKGWNRPIITAANKKTKPWAQQITNTVLEFRRDPLWCGPVAMTVWFQMPKPTSLPKRRYSFHLKKPDTDKLLRTLKDALTGIFYVDDSQVVHVNVKKYYADIPSMIVRIDELTVERASEFTERHLNLKGGERYGSDQKESGQAQGAQGEIFSQAERSC